MNHGRYTITMPLLTHYHLQPLTIVFLNSSPFSVMNEQGNLWKYVQKSESIKKKIGKEEGLHLYMDNTVRKM